MGRLFVDHFELLNRCGHRILYRIVVGPQHHLLALLDDVAALVKAGVAQGLLAAPADISAFAAAHRGGCAACAKIPEENQAAALLHYLGISRPTSMWGTTRIMRRLRSGDLKSIRKKCVRR